MGQSMVGSGLKILFSPQINVDHGRLTCVGQRVKVGLLDIHISSPPGNTSARPLNGPLVSSLDGPIVENLNAQGISFLDDSSTQLVDTPLVAEGAPLAVGVSCGRGSRRRGRASRGGRSGVGRGGKVAGVLQISTSHRFLNYARGRVKRSRPTHLVPLPIDAAGIRLHVDLPNLDAIPVEEIGLHHDGGSLDGPLGETRLSFGNDNSQVEVSAANRLLTIGRKIGVSFRC